VASLLNALVVIGGALVEATNMSRIVAAVSGWRST
jgi:hypothetical protein